LLHEINITSIESFSATTLKFSELLPETVMVIAYVVFNNVIEVDRNHNVVLDFGV